MMKKITVFLIVTLLMISFAVPAFAEESKAAELYKAYKAVADALEAKDPDDFVEKTDRLYELLIYLDEFTEDELNELVSLMGAADAETAEGTLSDALSTALEVAGVGTLIADYQADSNEETARALVEMYDLMSDPETYEPSAFERASAFYPNFGTLAEEARAMIPAVDVQAVYDAYKELAAAREAGTIEALRETDGVHNFLSEEYAKMSDSELSELAVLMGVAGSSEQYEIMIAIAEATAYIDELIQFDSRLEQLKAEPSVKNAKAVMEYYDEIFNDPEYADEDLQAEVRRYFPDIDEQYEEAKAMIPEVDADVMYEAYKKMKAAVDKRDLGAIRKARAKMEIAAEMFNSMNDEDEKALAELIGGEFEEAMNSFMRVNVYAGVVLNADELIDAYAAAPTEENAAALIEFYDAFYGESEYPMGSMGEIVREAIPEIDDAYEAAKKLEPFKRPVALEEEKTDPPTDEKEEGTAEPDIPPTDEKEEGTAEPDIPPTDEKEEEKRDPNIPLTGDDSTLWLSLLAAMICAAGVVILAKKAFAKK